MVPLVGLREPLCSVFTKDFCVSPNIPKDIYLKELEKLSLAMLPSVEELPGVHMLSNQQAPSQH